MSNKEKQEDFKAIIDAIDMLKKLTAAGFFKNNPKSGEDLIRSLQAKIPN